MFQELLSSSDQATLETNKDLSIPIDVRGFSGYNLQNITPFYWKIVDENDTIVTFIQPWEEIQDSISITDTKYTLISLTTSRPQVQSGSAPQNTWQMVLQLSPISLPSAKRGISVSNSATINLGNGTQVTLTGSNVVEVNSMPDMTLASNQQILIQNASLSTNVLNDLIQTGVCGISTEQSFNITNLASHTASNCIVDIPLNMYDSVSIIVYSANGYLNDYQFGLAQMRYQDSGMGGKAAWYAPPANTSFSFPYNGDNSNITNISAPINLGTPYLANMVVITPYNNTSNTLSDVIKVVVVGKYATQHVGNTTANPVPTQGQLVVNTNTLGNITATLPGGSSPGVIGTTVYSSAINVQNSKRVTTFITTSNLQTIGVNGSGVIIYIRLLGSYDGTTFFDIGGNSNYPNQFIIDSTSGSHVAWDSSLAPQMVAGYNYIQFGVYLKNSSSSTINSNAASATLGITVITQN